MNCQEALSLLYDVIDKEASEIDMAQVREHLDRCHDCAGVYKIEQSISRMIIEKARSPETNPHFDALKAKVLRQLDDIDDETV
jgi:mycothiol system anti-sigma-R factor